jgi:hypothetical protein
MVNLRCKFCALVLADSNIVKKGLSLEDGRKCCSTDGNHHLELVQRNGGIVYNLLEPYLERIMTLLFIDRRFI